MNKKEFILLITIISLIFLIGVTLFLTVFFSKEENIKYTCVKEFVEENNIVLTMENNLTAMSDGTVTEVTTKYTYKYTDETEYLAAKNYYKELVDMEYDFDDKNFIITANSNTNDYESFDSEENKIETWYKTYITSMNSLDYTCEKK